MINQHKKSIIGILLSSSFLFFGQTAKAEFPDSAVRLIVPFGAGGITDIIARHFSKAYAKALDQSVIIENKPGAGGTIGAGIVSRAKPNGYTVLMGTVGTQIVNPMIMSSLSYDPRDFKPVGMMTGSPYVLAASSELAVDNIKDLTELAKNKPGTLDFGSAGIGSSPHLGLELFKYYTETDIQHVPFKSGGEAVNMVTGGQVDLAMDAIPVIMPYVKQGKMKALVLASEEPIKAAEGVPTSIEEGFDDFTISSWNALFVPKGTPQEVVDTLNDGLQKALKDKEFIKAMEDMGSYIYQGTITEYDDFLKDESAKWEHLIKEANIKIQ